MDIVNQPSKRLGNYAITLPQYDGHKDHVVQMAAEFRPPLKGYIVGEEHHQDGNSHFHLYFYTGEKLSTGCVELREYFESYGVDAMDIQVCRVPKNWGRYCTKEDYDAVVWGNIPKDYLHIGYRIRKWTEVNEHFKYDQFICEHYTMINAIKGHHNDYWGSKYQEERMKAQAPVKPRLDHPQVADILKWFEEPNRHPKHLYVHGLAGSGKSTLVEYLLKKFEQVTETPCEFDKFEWSEVSAQTQCIYIPDAPDKYCKFHRSKLLRFCDNKLVSVNPKFGKVITLPFRGIVVIVSNYPPPQDDGAILRRFKVVEIQEEIYEEADETPVLTQEGPYDETIEEVYQASPLQ